MDRELPGHIDAHPAIVFPGKRRLDKEYAKRVTTDMTFDMQLLLAALGLALIMEGIPYFLWSEKMPEYLRFLSERPPSTLRKMGLGVIIAGLVLLFLARRFL